MGTRNVRFVACLITVSAFLSLSMGCEEPAPEVENSVATTPTGPPDDATVALTLRHDWPGDQAYRTITYEVLKGGDLYYYDDSVIPAELVDRVVQAANVNALPSDGLKSCRYAASFPTYHVTIHSPEEGDVALQSSSRCADWAPWNVVVDGALNVQLDGSFGRALLPLLKEMDPSRWDAVVTPKPGRFELTGGGVVPEGVKAQELAANGFREKLLAFEAFSAAFPKAKPESMRVLCSQKASPFCSELLGEATLPYRKGFVLTLDLALGLDAVKKIHWPETTQDLDALFKSKLFASFKKSAGDNPVSVRYDAGSDCRNLGHAASFYKPDVDVSTLSCALWQVSVDYEGATTLPPMIFYYPSLGAARLGNWSDHTDPEFYKRLKAHATVMDDVILERVRFFATLDGDIEMISK